MAPIRPATRGDLPILGCLHGAFYEEAGYAHDADRAGAALGELASDPTRGRLWIILGSEGPVGYLAVTFGFSLEYHGRDAFVDEVYIQPEARGRGLGRAALAAAESECRAAGWM